MSMQCFYLLEHFSLAVHFEIAVIAEVGDCHVLCRNSFDIISIRL